MEESAKIDMCPRCFERGFRDPQTLAQMLGGADHEAYATQAGGTDLRWELRSEERSVDLYLTWTAKDGERAQMWRAAFNRSVVTNIKGTMTKIVTPAQWLSILSQQHTGSLSPCDAPKGQSAPPVQGASYGGMIGGVEHWIFVPK